MGNTTKKRAEPLAAPLFKALSRSDYSTVIVPFMFIARCGVQWYG